MADEDPLIWEIESSENFLDEHFLYRGIHKNIWQTWENLQKIDPNFFMKRRAIEGLSTDWSKYADPQFTLTRLNSDLAIYGIAEINVGQFKNVIEVQKFPLTIHHDPIRIATESEPLNRAHTLIKGFSEKNTTKIRRKISKITKWAPNMSPVIEE
ncbi:MAG: hypothetical protein V3V33_08940 [Candidatus Lokiarchaeia archaeon]